MLTDVSALTSCAATLDRLAGELAPRPPALRTEVLAVRWLAPSADRCRALLAEAEARTATGVRGLHDGAALLRGLVTAVEQLEADMRRARADARASLQQQAAADRTRAPLHRQELASLPGASDPCWAAQVGAPRVALPDSGPAPVVPFGGPSPADRVDVDRLGVVLLARSVRSTGEAGDRAASSAWTAVSALPLAALDRYGLPGSRAASHLAAAVGPGSPLGRCGAAWRTAATRAEALAALVAAADAGHLGRPLDVVLTDPRVETALDVAASLPSFPSAAGARLLLSSRSTEDVAWLLEVVPGLASRLAEGEPPVDPVAFRALTPAERLRHALLHPSSVGAVDGVPADDRIAANRVLVVAARDDALAQLERYALQARAHGSLPPGARTGAERPPNPDEVARLEARVRLFDALLHDRVPNRDADPGEPLEVPRRLLLFDPSGDGRIAELYGDLDASTQDVAVLVPGTGSDLDSWGGFARRLQRFDEALPRGTAMIGWMGCDLPDDVVADAPFNSYADEGGPVLRDFVAGLDPLAPRAVTTVLGHSYGGALVGAAEREGMETDRVVHLASAGASVWSEDEYPHDADRYALMTNDDPIRHVQGVDLWGVGHKASPPVLFTRLETGAVVGPEGREGAPLTSGHDGYFDPSSDAFANVLQVITGGEVVLADPALLTLTWDGGPGLGREQHPSQSGDYDPDRVDVP